MIDCQALMRQLWAYLDGELTRDRVAEIEAHLGMCARCYPQANFERAFLKQLSEARLDHSNINGLRTRVMSALAAEGFTAP